MPRHHVLALLRAFGLKSMTIFSVMGMTGMVVLLFGPSPLPPYFFSYLAGGVSLTFIVPTIYLWELNPPDSQKKVLFGANAALSLAFWVTVDVLIFNALFPSHQEIIGWIWSVISALTGGVIWFSITKLKDYW